jgi:hypothetical protein
MFRKQSDEKEIECIYCHQKVFPIKKLNRAKSEFIGGRYTGKNKTYWLICPNCKAVIGTK